MGGYIILLIALVTGVLFSWASVGNLFGTTRQQVQQASIQTVAGSMIQFHLAALDFVTLAANSGTTWTFTDSDQRTVRTSASYTSGTYATAASQFIPPTFFRPSTFAGGSLNQVDWKVHYNNTAGTKLLVTYATSTSLAGYSPTQVAQALNDYALATTYTGWFWGVMSGSSPFTLSNGTTTRSLPATCAALGTGPCAAGLVGIVTLIP